MFYPPVFFNINYCCRHLLQNQQCNRCLQLKYHLAAVIPTKDGCCHPEARAICPALVLLFGRSILRRDDSVAWDDSVPWGYCLF